MRLRRNCCRHTTCDFWVPVTIAIKDYTGIFLITLMGLHLTGLAISGTNIMTNELDRIDDDRKARLAAAAIARAADLKQAHRAAQPGGARPPVAKAPPRWMRLLLSLRRRASRDVFG